ncbi:MAG: dTDP-4-dehydrorhamnose reductase [Vampirovibrionales bacterium]|nr:dTDP-4-dehydrorhamnose reductase [Vampirovibrionales bacterium]
MAIKRIVVTGAGGMLGRDLTAHLSAKGYDVTGLDSRTFNLLSPFDALQAVIARLEPELIVHAAAFTDVDRAEREPELAMAVNRDGARTVAEIARETGCLMAYVSTDFVFDGQSDRPYTPQDKPRPINAYGLSKYYGELAVQELIDTSYIIRTSWLYGLHGRNFSQFVLESVRQGRELSLVNDWTGSPTWTGSLSHMIEQIATSGAYGVYHAADAGAVSKYAQALGICRAAGLSTHRLKPVEARTLSFAAQRPAYSVLDCAPLPVPSWETSLAAYLTQYWQAQDAD